MPKPIGVFFGEGSDAVHLHWVDEEQEYVVCEEWVHVNDLHPDEDAGNVKRICGGPLREITASGEVVKE